MTAVPVSPDALLAAVVAGAPRLHWRKARYCFTARLACGTVEVNGRTVSLVDPETGWYRCWGVRDPAFVESVRAVFGAAQEHAQVPDSAFSAAAFLAGLRGLAGEGAR
jgi:hypothetical protein